MTKKINLCESIISDVRNINNKNCYARILQVIIDKKIKFTETSDGCFIDLNKCNMKLLNDIKTVIEQYNKHQEYTNNIIKLTKEAKTQVNKNKRAIVKPTPPKKGRKKNKEVEEANGVNEVEFVEIIDNHFDLDEEGNLIKNNNYDSDENISD